MGKVAQDQDEYVPMQPLVDPDYEASARFEMETSGNRDEKADTTEMRAKEGNTSDEHEYLEVIEFQKCVLFERKLPRYVQKVDVCTYALPASRQLKIVHILS